MFIVGINVAKRSYEAVIITEDGQTFRRAFHFRNDCTGYNLLLGHVRKLIALLDRPFPEYETLFVSLFGKDFFWGAAEVPCAAESQECASGGNSRRFFGTAAAVI